jgi:hypothetical protein
MMMHKFLLIMITAVGHMAPALSQEAIISSESKELKKKWNLTATVEHYEPLDRQNDYQSQFYGDFIYKLSGEHTLRGIQGWDKLYTVAQDEDEIQIQDTLLYHNWTLHKFGAGQPILSLRSGATLSLSEESKRHQIRTKTSFRLSISQKFFNDKFILSFRPFYNYQFNKFKQSPSGAPLDWYSYGYSVRADIKAFERWTLVTVIGHGLSKKQFTGTGGASPSDGIISIDSFINLNATEALAFRLGITQSGPQLQAGRLEVDPFDDKQTSVYSGIDYTF